MRVQVFSPHPDDVEIFMGGTLLVHVRDRGDDVQIVMATRGGRGTRNPLWRGERMRRLRTAEVARRMARIPEVGLHWLGFEDGGLRVDDAAVAAVAAQVEAHRPELVYLPERPRERSLYRHPDHLATAELVETALRRLDWRCQLRHYHTRRFNLLIDVSQHQAENAAALRCFASQYRLTADPLLLLHRRELLRRLMLRRWGLKNSWKLHEAINRLVAVAHLPVAPGTEAFRQRPSAAVP